MAGKHMCRMLTLVRRNSGTPTCGAPAAPAPRAETTLDAIAGYTATQPKKHRAPPAEYQTKPTMFDPAPEAKKGE
jgi:hypothetical protein